MGRQPQLGYLGCFLVLVGVVWFGTKLQSIICRNEARNNGTIAAESNKLYVDVGVVLDMNTQLGAMADVSMSRSLVDFYAMHPNYKTRLVLRTRDAVKDLLGPASAGRPRMSLFRPVTCDDDSPQVNAISAMFQGFGWHRVVLIYEDTTGHKCNGIIPQLTVAFKEIDVQIAYKKAIPRAAKDFQIMRELKKIMAMQTRVILVHMTSTTPLGSRLFNIASRSGMMTEGYAWLITDGLSNSLDEMDPVVIDSMEGVLGLRPYVPNSTIQLEIFQFKWKTELNMFGLLAYDTVWALAMGVERIAMLKDGKLISKIGPKILNEMLNTKLKGLGGERQPSAFEILNVVGKGERIIGYWTPDMGIFRELVSRRGKVSYSTSINELKKIIWPGDSVEKPVDRVIVPTTKKKLLAGIPVKKKSFYQIGEKNTKL